MTAATTPDSDRQNGYPPAAHDIARRKAQITRLLLKEGIAHSIRNAVPHGTGHGNADALARILSRLRQSGLARISQLDGHHYLSMFGTTSRAATLSAALLEWSDDVLTGTGERSC